MDNMHKNGEVRLWSFRDERTDRQTIGLLITILHTAPGGKVDSSRRFPFSARTGRHTHSHTFTDATERLYPTRHGYCTAGVSK